MPQSVIEFKLLSSLKKFSERILEEREQRKAPSCLSFGVPFLDEAAGGIYNNDLIIFGAKTGAGKTQLATSVAVANAAAGRRVHLFALEAEPLEIERRVKYQILSECFFKTLRKDLPHVYLNYLDWHYGKLDATLGHIEPEIEIILKDLYPGLWTFYRQGEFTINDFEKQVLAIQEQTDLIILDHLHYFDFDDDNENRAMKAAVKKIRDLALLTGKPVILIAHLRKSDRRQKQLVPGVDEFHGSSDITKIATKVITLAPCLDSQSQANCWPTYMRVAKCRVDGSRTRYTGLVGFNTDTMSYERPYFLGRLSAAEDEFTPISSFSDMPLWAKTGRVAPQ